MYKVLLGFLFGILLLFVVSRHVEFDVLLSEITDRFETIEVYEETVRCDRECSDEEIAIILEEGSLSDCGADQICRFQFALKHNDSDLCSDVHCTLLLDNSFNDFYFPHSAMLRYSLDYEVNFCEGSMSDFIDEVHFLNDEVYSSEDDFEVRSFYSDLNFNDFCSYLINSCDGLYSESEANCIKVSEDFSFWESYSNKVSIGIKPDSKIEFPEYSDYQSYKEVDKVKVLSGLRDDIQSEINSINSSNSETFFLSFHLLELFLSRSEIFETTGLDEANDLQKDFFKNYYFLFGDSDYLFDRKDDFEFTYHKDYVEDILDCNINSMTKEEIELNLVSDDGYSSLFENGLLLYLINESNCSDLETYNNYIFNSSNYSKKDYFYKTVNETLPHSLKYLYLFNVENENLERFLLYNIEKSNYEDFNTEEKMVLYAYLKDE
ncbi:MAG: hypothetical protein ACOCP4_00120 [Candidatus Woesearchaeota archaeon]